MNGETEMFKMRKAYHGYPHGIPGASGDTYQVPEHGGRRRENRGTGRRWRNAGTQGACMMHPALFGYVPQIRYVFIDGNVFKACKDAMENGSQ